MEIFTVENLSFSYPDSDKNVLKNISFSVNSGDFIAVAGSTASGKSTLLRILKKELIPFGKISGRVCFCGKETALLSTEESSKTGFVMQFPEWQTVTDSVWSEIAFGLENSGLKQAEIRRAVAETVSFFGIEHIFHKKTSELSGGQKQIVALASVTAMSPKAIILDEPTSQLDPVCASEFLFMLKKLNDELGITVIIAEHRTESIMPLCTKLAFIEDGELRFFDNPKKICESISSAGQIESYLPAASQIFVASGKTGECPLSVKEGRAYVEKFYGKITMVNGEEKSTVSDSKNSVLTLKNVCFKYSREQNDILHNTSLTVYENDFLCILGANGSGKSTLLNVCAGVKKVYAGSVEIFGKKIKSYPGMSLYDGCLSLLPQDTQTLFFKNTLNEDFAVSGITFDDFEFDLSYAANTHPYDLSGGERQLAALAKVLAKKPKILLLDEPTKGLDINSKQKLGKILKNLQKSGITLVAVTHDVDFAAEYANRCAMLFDGEITSVDAPCEFFSKNSFYTTSANKIMRDSAPDIITVRQAIELLKPNKGGS